MLDCLEADRFSEQAGLIQSAEHGGFGVFQPWESWFAGLGMARRDVVVARVMSWFRS